MNPIDPNSSADQAKSTPSPGAASAAEGRPLAETDIGLVRVLEDLIDVLMRKGVLQFTDLPEAAQLKLLQRQTARAGLQDPLRLLAPEGEELTITPGDITTAQEEPEISPDPSGKKPGGPGFEKI